MWGLWGVADVIIIGAELSGLSFALELQKRGISFELKENRKGFVTFATKPLMQQSIS